MSFAGMIVWRHASFPKRPQINHANTATLRESWISSMHADKHTYSRRSSHDADMRLPTVAQINTPPPTTTTWYDSVVCQFAKWNLKQTPPHVCKLPVFTSHSKRTYWMLPFPYSSPKHTHTHPTSQHRKRGIASTNHVFSTPRVTVYTNNGCPPTHTYPATGESTRKTQEDTHSEHSWYGKRAIFNL